MPHSSKYRFFSSLSFSFIYLFIYFFFFRKVSRKSLLNSGPPLALIIYAEEAPKMASTKFFTTTVETVTQLIVTSSLSQALHGLWCCHGPLEIEVFQNAATLPSRLTRQ